MGTNKKRKQHTKKLLTRMNILGLDGMGRKITNNGFFSKMARPKRINKRWKRIKQVLK
jgi:hypothetical protein